MVDINIERYFEIAKNASNLSDYPKIHIGACLIYKKQVLAIGYNSPVTHPMQKEYNIYRSSEDRKFDVDRQNNYIHAEMSCLVSTSHLSNVNWSKVKMFVYRKNGSCKPCRACQTALIERGIRDIYYTDNGLYFYEKILGGGL